MKDELLEKYSQFVSSANAAEYIAIAGNFLHWLKDREFSRDNIIKYMAHLKRGYYADTTILHRLGVIRRLALANGIPWTIRRDDKPKVNESDIYTPALDPIDIKAMVDCVRGLIPTSVEVKPEHAAFLALSTVYGLRKGEIREIQPRFLDVKNRSVFIQTEKGGRQRYHLIPDNIAPYLEAYDFRRRYSDSSLGSRFQELKQMIGFVADEVGWHSIRRSAVAQAWECGLSEPVIYSFYRWKRPMSNMALRYATAKIVGRSGERVGVSFGDRQVDEEVFKVHPFVRFWD